MRISLKSRKRPLNGPETPMDRLIEQQHRRAEITVSRMDRSSDSSTFSRSEGEKLAKVRVISKK